MCCFKVFGKHFMPFFLFAAIVLFQVPAMASGGIDPADPMVRVTSPPCDLDVNKVLAAVSKDVSRATGIKESFITYYWQTFDHVVYEGKETDKPLYVDLYVPGFFSDDDVKGMLNAVADAWSIMPGSSASGCLSIRISRCRSRCISAAASPVGIRIAASRTGDRVISKSVP